MFSKTMLHKQKEEVVVEKKKHRGYSSVELTSPVSHSRHTMTAFRKQTLKPHRELKGGFLFACFRKKGWRPAGITRKLPFPDYGTIQEPAPFVHLTKLLTQLEKVSSHQRLLTRPTSSWVNLPLINWGLHHYVVTASGAECIECPAMQKQQTIPQIMGIDC